MNLRPDPDPLSGDLELASGAGASAPHLLPEALAAVLDEGSACEIAGTATEVVVAALLASACDFLEGRLGRAASLALDAVSTIELTRDDEDYLPVALMQLERVATVLGDPVLLAEHGRAVAGAASGGTEPRRDEERPDATWTALEPLRPGGVPSYRRGAANARLAATLVARAEADRAIEAADTALADLLRTGSPREVGLVTLTAADALALLGRCDEADARARLVERTAARDQVVARALADHRAWFGVPGALDGPGTSIALDRGRDGEGSDDPFLVEVALDPAAILRATARSAVTAVVTGAGSAPLVRSLAVLGGRLGATLWVGVAAALEAVEAGDLSCVPARVPSLPSSVVLGMVAPAVVRHLDRVDRDDALLAAAIAAHPERWRALLREALAGPGVEDEAGRRHAAARLLAQVGEPPDLSLLDDALHRLAARGPDARLVKSLARRVAPRLEVRDLGRVSLALGDSELPPIGRRKVLALLCFLVIQPELAATREQVLDALWPDQDPEVAANSLNQTIYFLRRAVEPRYRERTSPDYLHHDAEIVWLDERLVTARSRRCRDLAAVARGTSVDAAAATDELAVTYRARFALDFMYEPWAESYREALHASFLAAMEVGIARAVAGDDPERAIRLAERTLAIDPGAEGIELGLLRLYRGTGAHAAAAERYAHYASVLRDELGVEPPPLDAL